VCRKVGYRTFLLALGEMKKVIWRNTSEQRDERSRGLNVYRCPICLWWHIGHREQEQGGERRERHADP
jgi:hypothetical protein